MVTKENVYEKEHPVSNSGVDYLIYLGQWEATLWASVIQVGVIDTDSPFTPFFGTTTTFSNQSGYSTSLINQTASNFSTSAWMIFCLSGRKRRTFWRTGREEGITLS